MRLKYQLCARLKFMKDLGFKLFMYKLSTQDKLNIWLTGNLDELFQDPKLYNMFVNGDETKSKNIDTLLLR